ncbi:MAG: M48 family peptidase [Betaproteobacteria bacterium]|nr:M48 family peptidase [Betaproteobacteria bacterium]
MHPFTIAFLLALALAAGVKLWLAHRHVRHVAGNRELLPREFEGSITLAAHRKAADYTIAKTRLSMIETGSGGVLVLAFTVGGGLEALSVSLTRLFEFGGHAHGIALIFSVVVVSAVIDLPFSIYRSFVIEERFNFNRMTPSLFVADLLKNAAVGAALGIPLLFCVLWLMAQMGEYWWLYVWLLWAVFNLLVLTLYPTLIAPLFNKFSPLEDAGLRERIEALLLKCGFRAQGLFVMDSSRRSSHGNAYFTGFGRAKRIVLFDTLIQRLSASEIEAVLAHELGHFSHRHVWKRIMVLFISSLAMLWLLGQLIDLQWFYTSLGAQEKSTAMALLLFFMALPSFIFLVQPVASYFSRVQEFEADAYAATHARAEDLVQALVKLYRDNAATLTPDPVHSAFYDSHPPAMTRIARLHSGKA